MDGRWQTKSRDTLQRRDMSLRAMWAEGSFSSAWHVAFARTRLNLDFKFASSQRNLTGWRRSKNMETARHFPGQGGWPKRTTHMVAIILLFFTFIGCLTTSTFFAVFLVRFSHGERLFWFFTHVNNVVEYCPSFLGSTNLGRRDQGTRESRCFIFGYWGKDSA